MNVPFLDVAYTYQNMSKLHRDLGDHHQAKQYYQRALYIKLNKLGPDHANVTELSRLLAAVQRIMDSQEQAPDHHDRTQVTQPQKRGLDQTDFEFTDRKTRREDDFCQFFA